MFKIFISFSLIVFLFYPFLIHAIIITEVQIEGESANDCYIKIYNTSSNDIDMSGYNLRKKTSTGNDSSIRVFPANSTISSNNYFIWASSRNDNFPSTVNADVSSTQYLARNNSIALLDKNRNFIDALSWGEGDDSYVLIKGVDNPEKGQIIKRKKENEEYINTKNNSNDFILYPPPLSPLQIKETIVRHEEKNHNNPLFFAIISSFLLSLIITYLNKKWQDIVTQKT